MSGTTNDVARRYARWSGTAKAHTTLLRDAALGGLGLACIALLLSGYLLLQPPKSPSFRALVNEVFLTLHDSGNPMFSDASTSVLTYDNAGDEVHLPLRDVAGYEPHQDALFGAWWRLGLSVIVTVLAFIAGMVLAYRLLGRMAGETSQYQQLLRGGEFAEPEQLAAALRRDDKASDLQIGPLPLYRDAETQHVFVSGATGTGKSTFYKQVLAGVRARGQRFVVYDTSGEYTRAFFRPGHDVLLNPFDERTALWSPWADKRADYDYDKLAESFLPDGRVMGSGRDPHWAQAGRLVFACLLQRLAENDTPYVSPVTRLTEDQDALYEYLKGTPAAVQLDPRSAEHSGSVLSILTPEIRGFKYLDDVEPGDAFSLRSWVEDEDNDRCLFLRVPRQQKRALVPLVSAWLDLIITHVLSMEESKTRRLFCALDELASLPNIDSLPSAVEEGRKYGLCVMMSITSQERFRKIYGEHDARTMMGLARTKLIYRCDEPRGARELSELLLEEDVLEERESVSYDSKGRGGASIREERSTRPLVMPSQILQLPDYEAYVKLGGPLPVTRLKVPEFVLGSGEPASVPRESEPVVLADVPLADRASQEGRSAQQPDEGDVPEEGDKAPSASMTRPLL